MPCALYFHKSSMIGISELKAVGDLRLKQKSPVIINSEENLFFDSFTGISDFSDVYDRMYNKNITTYYDYTSYSKPLVSSDQFDLELKVFIPNYQGVDYLAPILFTLKSTWVQYICTFLPITLILYFIIRYAFRSKILKSINN